MADDRQSRTWIQLVRTFTLFFGLNYLSCLIAINLLGNPLWCFVVMATYILVCMLPNESLQYYFSTNAKVQLSLKSLVDELKLMDIEKIPFVIERFLELDKTCGGFIEEDTICDSERCVVCLDEKAVIQTLPCRHRVICGRCAWSTFKMALKQPTAHTCVVCRGEIRDFNGSLFKNLVNVKWQDVKNVLDETKAM